MCNSSLMKNANPFTLDWHFYILFISLHTSFPRMPLQVLHLQHLIFLPNQIPYKSPPLLNVFLTKQLTFLALIFLLLVHNPNQLNLNL